jgi:carboxyl-terminal processing protease
MRLKKVLFFIIILLSRSYVFSITPPINITPYEVYTKTEEILKAHARYKSFNAEIAERALVNFLEELDPLKTYFIEEEIESYLFPTPETLTLITTEYKAQKFSQFEEIYNLMIKAIERRNSLEARVKKNDLIENVTAKEIHESGWAKTSEDLAHKIVQIKSLQDKAARQLASNEESELFFQRIDKRRMNREKELIANSKAEQKKQMYTYFLKSMSFALDTHTMYFTPAEARQFLIQVQQRLFGIGAQLRDDLNGLSIVNIVEGGPASRSKELKVGDKIIAVNHEAVIGMDLSEAVELIRGTKGSKVILTILREVDKTQEKFDIVIERDEVVLTERRYEVKVEPYGDGVIGHISLHSFYQDPTHSSSEDIRLAIEDLKAKYKLLGIVLDLRNNSGGLLPQAVNVSGMFLQKGVIATIKDCTGQYQRLRVLNEEPTYGGPLIILINRASASASEIVALSLSDWGRALIVGETSYGKGSYQTFTLEGTNPDKVNPQGEYKVTRGIYYTVGGRSPQLVGVATDIEVPGYLSYLEIGEKFSKYPLQNDMITPQFEDDLSDVHHLYRLRLKKTMEKNAQKKLSFLENIQPSLEKHSLQRIENNPNYQNFLREVRDIDKYELDLSLVGQNDLQLEETMNIMKELIALYPDTVR